MIRLISIVIYFHNGLNHKIMDRKNHNHIEKKSKIISKNHPQSITKKSSQYIRHIISQTKRLLSLNIQRKK